MSTNPHGVPPQDPHEQEHEDLVKQLRVDAEHWQGEAQRVMTAANSLQRRAEFYRKLADREEREFSQRHILPGTGAFAGIAQDAAAAVGYPAAPANGSGPS